MDRIDQRQTLEDLILAKVLEAAHGVQVPSNGVNHAQRKLRPHSLMYKLSISQHCAPTTLTPQSRSQFDILNNYTPIKLGMSCRYGQCRSGFEC